MHCARSILVVGRSRRSVAAASPHRLPPVACALARLVPRLRPSGAFLCSALLRSAQCRPRPNACSRRAHETQLGPVAACTCSHGCQANQRLATRNSQLATRNLQGRNSPVREAPNPFKGARRRLSKHSRRACSASAPSSDPICQPVSSSPPTLCRANCPQQPLPICATF